MQVSLLSCIVASDGMIETTDAEDIDNDMAAECKVDP